MGSYENNIFLILKTIYIKKSQFYLFYYSRLLYKLGKNSFFSNILVTSQQGSLRCTHLGKILQILSFILKSIYNAKLKFFPIPLIMYFHKKISCADLKKRGVPYMGHLGMRGDRIFFITWYFRIDICLLQFEYIFP